MAVTLSLLFSAYSLFARDLTNRITNAQFLRNTIGNITRMRHYERQVNEIYFDPGQMFDPCGWASLDAGRAPKPRTCSVSVNRFLKLFWPGPQQGLFQ